MTTRVRAVLGLLLVLMVTLSGLALIDAGVYGWTVFVALPVILGGVSCWVSRPATGARAAGRGALATATAACLLLGLGFEGLICVAMALPLVVPLGALGGWLFHEVQRTRLAAHGLTLSLLLPLA